MDNNTLIAAWNSWVANAPSNEWQGRQQAASILAGYLNHPDGNLYLDGLGLTSLPDHLPDSVKSLSVNDNHLTALPETLPDGIREIEVNNNLLTALPKHLPGSLASLDCENNLLKGLPDNLPDGLIRLNVSNNSLKTLPNTLPASLELLFADGNQLAALPVFSDTLLSSLVSLDLSNNQLTTVPDNLTKMTADDAMVRLTGNPLLPQSVSDLQSITLDPNYKGPVFDLKECWYTDKYKVAWGQWVDNAPNESERAARLKAVEALQAVAMNESVALDLSHLGLTSLPELLPPCLKVLNVSGNQLTQLPENLPGGLTALEARGNLLTTLPAKLPQGLEKLNVGNNKLIAIPDGSLPELITDLNLTGNLLTVIPDVLPDDLKKLLIGYNQIDSLPEHFLYRLHQYTIVDLRGNKLTGFPRDFLNTTTHGLTLNLGENPMSDDTLNELARVITDTNYLGPEVTLPLTTADQKILAAWEKWASEAPDATEGGGRNIAVNRLKYVLYDHSTVLELNNLGLTSLPYEFPSAVRLLILAQNKLDKLSSHFPADLKILIAYENKLTELPDTLPAELTILDVSNNKLTTLPEHLPDHLKDLNVRDNMLTSLPGYEDSFFSGLSLLNLGGNKLTTVPDNLVLAKGKAAVYLDNNPLPDSVITMLRQANYFSANRNVFKLPQTTTEKMLYAEWKKWVDSAPTPDEKISRQAAVKKMTYCLEYRITGLDLSSGNLTSLPDAFPPELKGLYISHNRLTTLPENLPGKLTYLDASENDISSITTHLPDSLTALNLSNNRLSALPDVLPTGLTSLFAKGNHIAVLPAFSDAFLSSLVTLNLSGNNITTLPDSLINLRNRISRIDLSGNPLSDDIILAVRQRYLALEPDLPAYKLPLLSKEIAYTTTLQQWVQNSPTALEKTARGAAMDRIMDCLLDNKTKLDLSSLNLTTLPDELPPPLIHIDISGNQLTTLPDLLPAGLKKLYAEHNRIRVLPARLPTGLQVMDFCDNEITSLPAWSSAFVSSIDALDVSKNRLTSIPLNLLQDFNNGALLAIEENNFSSAFIDQMRAVVTDSHYHGAFIDILRQDYLQTYVDSWNSWVNAAVDPTEKTVRISVFNELEAVFAHDETALNLSKLNLTSLAERLPPTLTSLNVSNNKLTELPEHLPGGLKSLYANNNTLSKLPDNLSSRLTHLEVNNNKLVTLPDHLPDGLKDLSVRNNLLTRLPLPSDLPTVSWFRADGNRQPLSVAVTAWFAGDPDSVTAQWQSLDREGNSIFLGDLLVRLLWTKNGKSAGFKTQVTAWLEQLLADPALQESAFAQASEAFDTCDDKALLVFNTLQDESLTQAITTGQLDTSLPDLLSVAREIFRRQALDRIAKAKADLLFPAGNTDNAEHVEVYLGYQVALKQRLGLTHTIDDMNYFTSSHLTQADLDAAEAGVKSQESTQFSSWLAHWAPWQGVLERFDAAAFDDARENLIEKLDETAPRENIEYLRRGYTGSNDATITPAVKKEVESLVEQQLYEECYGPIATQLFKDAGLEHLLDDPWVARGAKGGVMPTIQRLLDLNNLLQSGLHNLADIVSQQQTDGIHVLFAPQSFLLGDDAERGICDSLSEAWLYALAQEDNGALRTTLLDNVFLRSQYLIADAAAAGRVTGTLSDDMQAFLDTLRALDTTGPRTIQSLSEVVHQLASASGDVYLSLHTGNHALALARRTLNAKPAFWLYDPNFGEAMLPVSGAQDDGSALTSLINNVLGMKAGDGQETLADYYQTERQNGDYSFTIRTVNTASLPTRPDLQALQAQLHKAVVPDVPPTATSGEVLSPELESLRQSVQEKLGAVLSVDVRQAVKQAADDTAGRLWDKIRQAAVSDAGGAGGLKITGVEVLPAEDPLKEDITLKVTSEAADGSQHETTVSVSKDELVIAEPDIQGGPGPDEASYAAGYGVLLKSLGLYSVLTSLTGLITSAGQGDVKGEATSGIFLVMSVSDITGLVDKLADRFAAWTGITGTEAFGGGLAGLMGKGASELALLAGLGGGAAATVGKLMADAPLLQAAVLGFTLYSDITALKDAPTGSPEYVRALGMLATDASVGLTVVIIGGLVMTGVLGSVEGGGIGGILATVGIVIDVMIQSDNPLGLRQALNPGSLKIEGFLKGEQSLYTDKPEDLYCIRALPAGAAGQTRQVLSFIVAARSLPAVETLLEDKMTLSLQQYLAGLTADTLKTYGNDTSVLIKGMIAYLTTPLAAAQRQAVSEGKLTEAEQIQGQINALPGTLALWRPLLDSARAAITHQNVSDDDVLSYLINPDFPLPVSACNGDLGVVMTADGRGFTVGWTTPYGYDDSITVALGPERLRPRPVSVGQAVSDVMMGMGQTLTTRFYDSHYGDITLGAWDEDREPSDVVDIKYDYPVSWDLDPERTVSQSSVKTASLDHRFSITGSDLDTRYYSQWSDPTQGYAYTINGGKGDDTLFLGAFGQYTFNGGGGTNRVVASATKRPDADYSVFDLQPAGSPVSTEKYSLHKNFSLTMTNVASIQGSDNNEIFHGDDRSNIIVTGGGHNVVWLSGGGDRYGVSGSVIFYGQTGRKADAPQDIVMLSKVNLADLTLGDKQLSGAGVQVTTDDLASEQLIFVTEDRQILYVSGGRWALELTVPDLSQLPSLHVALPDGAGRLGVPGLAKVFLPGGPFPGMVALHDGASGLQAIMQYDAGGNVTQAILSLSENFTALTVDNMKTYIRLVAGIDKVQWRTRDNVLFRLVKQTAADGSARQVLLIDHIDAPAGAVQPDLTLPDGNALGVDMVVADVTGLVQSGPSQDNGLWIGANPAASILLRYQSTQTLTAGALSSLKWINEDDKRFTLQLPDSRKISTGNAPSLKQFVLSLGDAQGNGLEGDFSAGVLTQAVLTLKQTFDSGLDTAGLLAQSDTLSAAGGSLMVKTQDGVTFRFVRRAGTDGKPQLTAVVDAVDAVAYKAAHDPHVAGGTLPFGTWHLPGVDALAADVTALVQASGLSEDIVAQSGLAAAVLKTTLVRLGTPPGSRKTIYHYRTAQVMNAQMLGALRWQAGVDPDLWLLDLQDGHAVCVSRPAALSALTLVISDAKGSEWQITYDDADTPPQMVQAVDAKGLSPFAVMQGVLTAVYGGDAVQKTGVSIDLSQPVQAGGESLAGVTQVSGSAYADVLSGNGGSVVLSGGGGNDVLSGGGVALLVGGAGADTYVVKPGDNVLISAQGNGTATDTLVFAEQDTGALSFALKDDDLVVSSADRVAVLKNWAKGDNHYRLSGSDGERDEAAFRSLVQDSLALPGLLKALSAQYTALAQRNAAGAQVVTPIPLDAGKWQVTSVPHSGAFMPGPGGMGLNGPVVVTQATGSAYDALADYRLVVTLAAGALGLSGFHVRLKAGGSVLTATTTPVSGNDGQVTVTVEAKGGGQVVASGTLSVELEEEAGHGGVVVQAVQLEKVG